MLLALRSLWEGGADVIVDGSGLGVAASPAIGTGRIDVDFTISGIAGSPAIGNSQVDVATGISGVAASPGIGAASVAVDFSTQGIAASPAVGDLKVDVDFTLQGVAANPAIGEGTVTGASTAIIVSSQGGAGFSRRTPKWFKRAQQKKRQKRPISIAFSGKGVSANPQLGKGRPEIAVFAQAKGVSAVAGIGDAGRIDVELETAARLRAVHDEGVAAPSQSGSHIAIDSKIVLLGTQATPQIGRLASFAIVDLTEEEMMVLLLAA